MYREEAVVVRNARKSYGNGVPILDGLNLTVPKGCIYGLLGASGCGKTTLLSCIVGIRNLDSGDIWVLGGRPCSKGSGIPGSSVGYMPQDICLVQEFSVIGTLYYFGRINGLNDKEIEERYVYLADLLQLPSKNRLLRSLSGGQQRRVSFAAALLHRPELLILDEPTVGLDPVLRDNIWKFLMKISEDQGVTIIITTHYIEEAKEANKVGLLRCGKLLAEATPHQLLTRFQCENLEDAFLALSRLQQENANAIDRSGVFFPEIPEALTAAPARRTNLATNVRKLQSSASCRFKALLIKNLTQFIRHPGGILFAIIFPLIQSLVFYTAFGMDPRGLKISVVNHEAGNCDFNRNRGLVLYDEMTANYEFVDLSCRFLHGIDDDSIEKVYYDYLPDAEKVVRRGEMSGIIHFGRNFSRALKSRVDDMRYAEDEDIVMGEIQIWLDMSNRQVGFFLRQELYKSYFNSFKKILKECHVSPKIANIPIRFEEPIFGSKDEEYTTFSAPTFIMTVIFFLAASVTTAVIISDRHEGVWDRSLVQGVKTPEILLAHFLIQFMVVIIQIFLIYCVTFFYFQLKCKGSFFASLIMSCLMGICGMFFGFLISVVSSSHTMANYAVTGSFYPVILLGGFLWPVEGMPHVLRWISYFLPTTLPGISMRAIIIKGLTVSTPEVYKGFLTILGWIAALILICLYRLKTTSS
ncbi:hypothetical protein KPH14_007202 [Odynerus spinipes]|uniref:ABC transporter domain-containing protein n=1 Tax=Odynerus spinipes TaxID=1348599 RepID=A0AAD9VIH2_9HYME|nr:hypothetical protein KPH14_007202 [Odynerus spinipes]